MFLQGGVFLRAKGWAAIDPDTVAVQNTQVSGIRIDGMQIAAVAASASCPNTYQLLHCHDPILADEIFEGSVEDPFSAENLQPMVRHNNVCIVHHDKAFHL